jgi:sulfonate transport system substrate-binding protein
MSDQDKPRKNNSLVHSSLSRRTALKLGGAAAAFSIIPANRLFAAQEEKPAALRFSTGAGSPFGKPYSGGSSGPLAALGFVEEEFKDDGIKIEWFHLTGGGPASNEALASNTVDFGYAGEFPAIFGRAGGLKTKLIGGGFRGNNGYLTIPANSTVTKLADLKGKRISIQKGQPWEYGFDSYLRSEGYTQSDFEVVNLSFPDTLAALKAGNLDAAYVTSTVFQLLASNTVKVLWSTKEAPQQWKFVADWFVREDFAEKYPTTVKRVAKALVKFAHFATQPENREKLYETWALTGFPIDNYRNEWDDKDLRFRLSPIPDAFIIEHYKLVADYLLQNKLIRRPVTIDDWVDRSFVDQAIAELNLQGYFPEFDALGVAKPA